MDSTNEYHDDYDVICHGCGKTISIKEAHLVNSDPFYPGVDEACFCKA